MNNRTLQRIVGLLVFVTAAVIYFLTVQPSVSFWDPGEIASASYSLMVPHPPGGPMWLIVGRLFSMIPFAGNIGLRINSLSVIASCFAVMLLYLVAVKIIESYRSREYKSSSEALLTYLPAATGALAFAFCDTFWFNALEANYFAVSTLLYSLVVWLMMLWHERYNSPDNEKYIILMAYIIGISAGVHLMSMLAILTFVGVLVMKKYVTDEVMYKKSAYIFLIHLAILAVVALGLWASQTASNPPSPDEYQEFDSKFKWIMAGISVIFIVIFRDRIFNRSSFYMPLIAGAIVLAIAYPGMVKYFPALLLAIFGPDPLVNAGVYLIILAGLAYLSYWAIKKGKALLNLSALCLLFALIGFSTYSMIIIRATQQPPMNENDPQSFKELDYYLGREQYGDFPAFKRRFSSDPNQQAIYTQYNSDLDFLWRYQINHMYNRYVLWNFVGRESYLQDSGVDFKDYFAIPFIFGLLGLYFYFRKDWKMASAFLILFVFMGYLIAFYQNQQEPQPRERDYFYPGALFVFCLWIAVGVKEVMEIIREKLRDRPYKNGAAFAFLALAFLFIPVRMIQVNYFTHDRSHDWVPWDMSYNLLQSCKPNAILFTNGDNDTFPLWFLQYVEGVRRDIRIVNLSLANTDWYIKQLKHTEPYGTASINFSLTDEQINGIEPMQWEPQNIAIPVDQKAIRDYGVTDTTVLRTGRITFRMNNTLQYGNVKAIRVQDVVVRDIVISNSWDRPIYFAATTPRDAKIGLDDYLQTEGLASRLLPQKGLRGMEDINEPVMRRQLLEQNPSYSTTYMPGFKFRGINQKGIFYDETHLRMIQSCRIPFLQLAYYYTNVAHNNPMTLSTLDAMEKSIPRDLIEIDYRSLYDIANLYRAAGSQEKFRQIGRKVESEALKELDLLSTNPQAAIEVFRILEDLYINLKEYDKAINLLQRLQSYYPEDTTIKAEMLRIDKLRQTP
ncbi:MAG: DUF2723 domain-containing protein [Ignavibacteria bacterium]|jgi:hypothetical protein|nr:DUF2723 domain-containing protein [Ignavibacteria bacterium]MCU7504863.1 DUF2723 domain-containing protein [Ignavibacteria bacterium]MCU7518325.1 DUF2723 domain-containing protein [Ignavibacteria bacterium]